MRIVVQRVKSASVRVADFVTGEIAGGLLVFVGVEPTDSTDDIEWLATKLVQLRVLDDEAGIMGRSVADQAGEILLVSQFTLHASTRKGSRPSWHRAAKPEVAKPLYEAFHRRVVDLLGRPVPTGAFGADMEVCLINDGPVTLIIDSKLRE